MRIENIKINCIKNPMGYLMENIRVSFVVKDSKGKRAECVKVEISDQASFSRILCKVEGIDLDTACIPVELKTEPRTRYYVRVTVLDDTMEIATADSWFETSKQEEPWAGKWLTPQDGDTFHPVFAKEFTAGKEVESARLYISGLGMYAADLNGDKIGQEILTPYYSNYRKEIQYQTYDITALVTEQNRLEVRLADGWYKGKFDLGNRPNQFGDGFHLMAEIRIRYTDGTQTVIGTDESWLYRGSDTEESGIYDGQIINRLLWEDRENPWKAPVESHPEGKLIARYSLPVREMEELPVKEVIHTPKGESVLDFGQNFAGFVQFQSAFPAGTKIVLDFGEIMQEGCFYRDNYRSAKSQFTYISDGRAETVKPEFTYFGFRYVRVTGWPGQVQAESFLGKVLYSEIERTGFLETGHEKVNRLFLNALWGQKSNFVDFPTDCPQRDERLGWSGDCQVFSGTACYNMDCGAFYQKFLHDLRTEQVQFDGILPGRLPVQGFPIFSSVWGDLATILPTVLFRHYGDSKILEQNYAMMCDWVDKITREDINRGQRYLYDFGGQLGDWLALNGRTPQSMQGGTDEYFIGSCYYANSVKMTADAAQALGHEEEAKNYRELYAKIYDAILNEYFTTSGRLCIDTQTGYIVSLFTGIYRDKHVILRDLQKRLYRDCNKLTGGFTGAPIMCRALAENGMVDEAFYFLLQEGYPGWLNCVNLGATTIWERWNSVLPDGRISGTQMNSLNHYAYGAVVEFLYRDVAGLQAAEPGFRKAVIAPMLNSRLGHTHLRYESAYGTYQSNWDILEDGRVHVCIQIPFGCSAQVILPHYDGEEIGVLCSGSYDFTYVPTVEVRAKYTVKTMFKDMLSDEQAVAVIKQHTPMLMFFLGSGDEDFLCETPETLMNMGFMGFREEDVKKLQEEITKII
ncbi:MAG: family 78 glycoside hydrolase catalytic domain [Faecousia sp.]